MKFLKRLGIVASFLVIGFSFVPQELTARWGFGGGWRGGFGRHWHGGYWRGGLLGTSWGCRWGWCGRPWGLAWGWRGGPWWPGLYGVVGDPGYVRSKSDVWRVVNHTDQEIRIKPRGVAPVSIAAGRTSRVARGENNQFYLMPQSGKGMKGRVRKNVIEVYDAEDGALEIESH